MGAWTPSVVISPAPEHTVGGDVPGDRWVLHLGPPTCEGRAVRMEGDMGVPGASPPSLWDSEPDQCWIPGQLFKIKGLRVAGEVIPSTPPFTLSVTLPGRWVDPGESLMMQGISSGGDSDCSSSCRYGIGTEQSSPPLAPGTQCSTCPMLFFSVPIPKAHLWQFALTSPLPSLALVPRQPSCFLPLCDQQRSPSPMIHRMTRWSTTWMAVC